MQSASPPSPFQIRHTLPEDRSSVLGIHRRAFGHGKEAALVDALLDDPTSQPMLSLLALENNVPAGHILFTRARFKNRGESPLMHILAPLAVAPEFQRAGVGGTLIREGVARLTEAGSVMLFVLGHKEYYPRHGFLPHATRAGFDAPYPIPEEASEYWMYRPLCPTTPEPGPLACADALDRLEHWRE